MSLTGVRRSSWRLRWRSLGRGCGRALVVAIGAADGAVPAEAARPRATPQLEVAIVRPVEATPIFGPTEVVVEIYPAKVPVALLEVYLDGLQVAAARAPVAPFRFTVDAGQENAPHLLEVVATAEDGRRASATRRTTVIRTDDEVTVGLEQVYVTVVDGKGAPVADLTAADFSLRDEGQRQTLVTFERGDVPFTAVLALDASASMRGRALVTALSGVRQFAAAMGRLDEAKLVLFDDRVRQETPFTSLPSLLTLTLPGLVAGGGTALSDALALATLRLADRQGRRVVVLLSDGVDVESVLDTTTVARLVERTGAALYWVRLGAPQTTASRYVSRTSAWRDVESHRQELADLARLVDDSGGRQLPVDGPEDIGRALGELLTELRGQYVLGFYPAAKRGRGTWHRLEVGVERGGVDIRARRGYSEP